MTFPSKDEIIEKMARGIWEAVFEQEKPMDLGSWDELHVLGRLPYLDQARTAFNALVGCLPSGNYSYIKEHNAEFKGNELITTLLKREFVDFSANYYKQLISMKD